MFLKRIAVLLAIIGVALAWPIGPNAILKPNPKSLVVECYLEDREMVKDLLQSKRSDMKNCGWKNQTELLRLYDENIQIFVTSESELMQLVDEIDECANDDCKEELYEELRSLAGAIFDKMWANIWAIDEIYVQETEEAQDCLVQAWAEIVIGLLDFFKSMEECLSENLQLRYSGKILNGK